MKLAHIDDAATYMAVAKLFEAMIDLAFPEPRTVTSQQVSGGIALLMAKSAVHSSTTRDQFVEALGSYYDLAAAAMQEAGWHT